MSFHRDKSWSPGFSEVRGSGSAQKRLIIDRPIDVVYVLLLCLCVVGSSAVAQVESKDAAVPRGEAIEADNQRVDDRGLRFGDLGLGSQGPRRRFAVCIGIHDYLDAAGYPDAPFAGEDAVEVAEALLEGCQFERVLLLTDAQVPDELQSRFAEPRLRVGRDVSRDGIQKEVEPFFAQATNRDDVVMFYFAGHSDAKESAYLVAGDYRDDAPWKVVHLSTVFEWIWTAPAQNRLVIFDACRSSPAGEPGQIMVTGFHNALTHPQHRMVVMSACGAGSTTTRSSRTNGSRWIVIKRRASSP